MKIRGLHLIWWLYAVVIWPFYARCYNTRWFLRWFPKWLNWKWAQLYLRWLEWRNRNAEWNT